MVYELESFEGERLIVDGAEGAKIAAAVTRIEILVSKVTLTVKGDGANVLTKTITR